MNSSDLLTVAVTSRHDMTALQWGNFCPRLHADLPSPSRHGMTALHARWVVELWLNGLLWGTDGAILSVKMLVFSKKGL